MELPSVKDRIPHSWTAYTSKSPTELIPALSISVLPTAPITNLSVLQQSTILGDLKQAFVLHP